MYERFISSSILTGILFEADVLMNSVRRVRKDPAYARGAGPFGPAVLNVQIPYVERVVFDELAAWLDLVAHECGEHLVRFGVVFGAHLHQRAVVRVHRRVPERVGIHLAETLVAVDRHALLARDDEKLDEVV